MDVLSPLPAIACLAVALLTSWILMTIFGAPKSHDRFATIDGLRGYLAFFVFVYHASIWYGYMHSGKWQVPASNLYTNFGQTSVTLFFMITGFLFYRKLLKADDRKIDWLHLYVSRVLRLGPLYAFVMVVLLVVVAVASKGAMHETSLTIFKEVVRWLSFTILGAPPINGLADTWIVVAGVTWSLPYEWFFYLSLPILALVAGNRPTTPVLIFGGAGIVALIAWRPSAVLLGPFAGGIAAAYLVRYESFGNVARHWLGSLLALACLASTIILFESSYALGPLLLLSVAFALIACGADLFGVLTKPVSRMLGEQAYSIYLLHGVLLFISINFVIGKSNVAQMSPMNFWSCIVALAPALICISYATFRLIESPALKMTPDVTNALRSMASFIGLRSRSADTAR